MTPNNTSRPLNPGIKLFLDLAPLAAFFIGYRLEGLMLATALIIIATLTSLAITYYLTRTLALSPLITAILVAFFGGLTLLLQDEHFIKIKPTIINLLFATVLLIGVYGFKRGLLHYIFDAAVTLSDEGWLKLSRNWGFFFLFLALLNELIWRNFSTDFWVEFKVFGMLSSTLVFTLTQMPLLKKYHQEKPVE